MSEGYRPPFNALANGLFRHLIDGAAIAEHAWNRARSESGLVGTCRLCGGHLRPLPTLDDGVSHLAWMEAQCVLCGHEVASPAGRLLRRSSRHSEQPAGWWEWRMAHLAGRD